MLKRKIIACILALCLVASLSGMPSVAIAVDGSQEPVTALSDTYIIPSSDQSTADSAEQPSASTPATDPEPPASSGGSSSECQSTPDDGTVCSAQPVGEAKPLDETTPVKQSSDTEALQTASTESPQASTTGPSKDVQIDVKENIDVVVDSKSTAVTGTSDSQGTDAANAVGGTSKAVALAEDGKPANPNEGYAVADNDVAKGILNSGTASSESGLATSKNTMDENTATIAPEASLSVDVLGELIDSNVIVKVIYNYLASITGAATAQTGNSNADGLIADNSINSTDTAMAIGDSSSRLAAGSGGNDGSALAKNDSGNGIENTGTAMALTGEANADNTLAGSDILIAPIIDTFIKFCGNVINSEITIELVYNFLAAVSGQANAVTGNANAVGGDVANSIDNYSSAKAVGDAPSGFGSGLASDGSAQALNDTSNGVTNAGAGFAMSGNADASNTMVNNDIEISPEISNAITILEPIINSNVVIRITYNVWAMISGVANAITGDVNATGVNALNAIDNTSTAGAVGDAASVAVRDSGGLANGEATAVNQTANSIDNVGTALGVSGDASAINEMVDNLVKLSPVLNTVITIGKPIVDQGLMVIDVIVDVWTTLTGQANAITGDASSTGVVAGNAITSNSNAVAIADVSMTRPDGSVTALNASDNEIANNGLGVAATGSADAQSYLNDTAVVLDDCLTEMLLIDICEDTSTSIGLGYDVDQAADAITGEANAEGSVAASLVTSDANSRSIFGGDSFSKNRSDDDVYNNGEAWATTQDAKAAVGRTKLVPPGGGDTGGGGDGGGDTGSGEEPTKPDQRPDYPEPPTPGVPGTPSVPPSGGSSWSPTSEAIELFELADSPLIRAFLSGFYKPPAGKVVYYAKVQTAAKQATVKSTDTKTTKKTTAPAATKNVKRSPAKPTTKKVAASIKHFSDVLLYGGDAQAGSQKQVNVPWWLWVAFAGALTAAIRFVKRRRATRRQ